MFQDNLSKYCEAKHEPSRYPPFIELSNHVIRQLNTNPNSNIRFCRNDPVIVVGSRSKRKPDVVGVRYESIEVPNRSSVDNIMNDGPKEAPFGWTELLFFFEFKLEVVLKDALPRNAVPRDHNSSTLSIAFLIFPLEGFMVGVVPLTLNSSVAAPSPVPAPRSPIPSALGSKRSPGPKSLSSMPSPGSKKRKLDGAADGSHSMVQCASYALEMMSHGGLRSHVIGALVTDGTIQLLYYDRSIIIASRPVEFLDDNTRFIAMLQAMSNSPLSRLGYADVIPPPTLLRNTPRTADIFVGLELELSNKTRLVLGSTIYHQHGIIGRGTCLVQAKCVSENEARCDDDSWAGSLVVKLSWPAKSRISENDLIAKARYVANQEQHRWVLKHLPKVLHAEDRHITSLSRALIDRMGDLYEERVLRIIVQDKLYPITERTTAVDLAQSFREIFKCRHLLVSYCNSS
jgi:hypothetical protein